MAVATVVAVTAPGSEVPVEAVLEGPTLFGGQHLERVGEALCDEPARLVGAGHVLEA
ncbi:MAG: hypothetical protein R3E53_09980 [Myxococcota bacterium]